jgi:hypothetical protein
MKGRGVFLVMTVVWLIAPAVVGATTLYDTSGATITCNTLVGTVAPKPFLTLTAEPNTVITIKGTLGGCTVSGAVPADPPLRVLSGKLTAKLTVITDASCATLVSGGFQVTGDLVLKWKTATGQKLDFSSSVFTPDAAGLVAGLVDVEASTYGAFTATGTLASGSAFAGGTPGFFVLSAEDIFNMAGQCCTDAMSCSPVGKGIRKLHFGIGQIQM